MLQIFNYTAGKGDCIRLRYAGKSGVIRNVIIDTGVIRFAPRFHSICSEISDVGEQVDVLILTHVDDDHIGGLLGNLRQKRQLPIKEVWMNHGSMIANYVDLSVKQNDEVYTRLTQSNIPVKSAVKGDRYELDGASFHVLWPTKDTLTHLFGGLDNTPLGKLSDYGFSIEELMEMPINHKDTSLSNHASIVFEFEYDKVRCLFTGDAWSEDILDNLENGNYDLVKLPHHGSVRNLSEEWCNKIQCKNFMICTDGIMHPDKQTIAKLLKWYERIHVYGAVPWWNKFMTEKEMDGKIHFVEGEEIRWE